MLSAVIGCIGTQPTWINELLENNKSYCVLRLILLQWIIQSRKLEYEYWFECLCKNKNIS